MRLTYLMVLLVLAGCGKPGATGSQGAQGAAGQSITGSPGQNGTNATPVTMVQFCPGTTHYPDTFCEVGFKLGSAIYGTYSANDGFSAYLPPGSYSSNGINCACNFTINADGSVSN